MQNISKGSYPGRSVATMLPIINLDPTDINCIHSTFVFITKQATMLNVVTAVVTSDQSLWIKDTEIVQKLDLKLVLILGGFHMMMSFAGSLGMLMSGSGLDTILETSYVTNSVKQMLSGKSFAMFLCASFLTESALMLKIMSMFFVDTNKSTTENFLEEECRELANEHKLIEEEESQDEWQQAILNIEDNLRKLSVEETDNIRKLSDDIQENYDKTLQKQTSSQDFNLLRKSVGTVKEHLQKMSRTARLWVNYLNYINIIKNFIHAECTGNWKLNLQSVKEMRNLFHYTKSVRLYLQKMISLN